MRRYSCQSRIAVDDNVPGITPACATPRKKRAIVRLGASRAKPVASVMRPLLFGVGMKGFGMRLDGKFALINLL